MLLSVSLSHSWPYNQQQTNDFSYPSGLAARVQHEIEAIPEPVLPARDTWHFGKVEKFVKNTPNHGGSAPEELCAKAIANEIDRAINQVCLQTYQFIVDHPAAAEIVSAIARAQERNPDFKAFIVVNSTTGNVNADIDGLQLFFERYNAKISLATRPNYNDSEGLTETLLSRASLHSKSAIIDGRVAIVGGKNIDNPNEADLIAVLVGPVVSSLLSEFFDSFSGAMPPCPDKLIPSDLLNSTLNNPIDFDLEQRANPGDYYPIQIIGKKGSDSGAPDNSRYNTPLLKAIDSAKSVIRIVTPNLNDPEIIAALKRCGKRKHLKVEIILPRHYIDLKEAIDALPNEDAIALLSEYRNIRVRWFSIDRKNGADIHTKLIIADGEWAYLGSLNLDRQSWRHSRELGVGLVSRQAAADLSKIFRSWWQTSIPSRPNWFSRVFACESPTLVHRLIRALSLGVEIALTKLGVIEDFPKRRRD
jgi:cardiolipin synthase